MQNKLFHLRMDENDTVKDNRNVFNTLLSQLVVVDINIKEEDNDVLPLSVLL